jgi:hypothetical protein
MKNKRHNVGCQSKTIIAFVKIFSWLLFEVTNELWQKMWEKKLVAKIAKKKLGQGWISNSSSKLRRTSSFLIQKIFREKKEIEKAINFFSNKGFLWQIWSQTFKLLLSFVLLSNIIHQLFLAKTSYLTKKDSTMMSYVFSTHKIQYMNLIENHNFEERKLFFTFSFFINFMSSMYK